MFHSDFDPFMIQDFHIRRATPSVLAKICQISRSGTGSTAVRVPSLKAWPRFFFFFEVNDSYLICSVSHCLKYPALNHRSKILERPKAVVLHQMLEYDSGAALNMHRSSVWTAERRLFHLGTPQIEAMLEPINIR
jgi:hypothetical protein